jgi:hypothetical protein
MFEVLMFWNLIFWIIQTNLDGEMTIIEVVDLDEIYKFVADDFFIWNNLWSQILFEILMFWNLNFPNCANEPGWWNNIQITVLDIGKIDIFKKMVPKLNLWYFNFIFMIKIQQYVDNIFIDNNIYQ